MKSSLQWEEKDNKPQRNNTDSSNCYEEHKTLQEAQKEGGEGGGA